ncbi:MAG: helix-turn-helix domain-containing protein [Gemmatimonadota bacterium]|nr:MAG: helix-turn-helix domain-containing protein [Gemmatimonadota bacterium]
MCTRMPQILSQHALAELIGSSQSRVAKMEAGDPSVTLDLLVRSMLSTGLKRAEIPRALNRTQRA